MIGADLSSTTSRKLKLQVDLTSTSERSMMNLPQAGQVVAAL